MGRNGGPQRDELQKAFHRAQIARRRLMGESQARIAASLRISQQLVSRELRSLQEEWQRNASIDFAMLRAEQLATLNMLQSDYWRAWERSCLDEVVTVYQEAETGDLVRQVDEVPPKGDNDNDGPHPVDIPSATHIVAYEQTTNRAGNPAFLKGVGKCISEKTRLFGLDDPQLIAATQRSSAPCSGSIIGFAFVLENEASILRMKTAMDRLTKVLTDMEPEERNTISKELALIKEKIRSVNRKLAVFERTNSDSDSDDTTGQQTS